MRDLERVLKEVKHKVLMMLGVGIIETVDDGPEIQRNQVTILDGETHGDYDRFQEFGFSSVPLPGCQAVIACVGGARSHGLIIATDDGRYRPVDLAPGETILYNYLGDYIKIDKDRKITVVANTEVDVTAPIVKVNASTRVDITSPQVNMTGNLQVDGNITCDGNVSDGDGSMTEMRGTYNSHTHAENGSTTNAPNQLMN